MGTISKESGLNGFRPENNRVEQLKAFDDTKKGVKGLVDSGAKTIPCIFIRPSDELSEDLKFPNVQRQVPIIDFEGIDRKDRYEEIVKQILEASQKWGFFQVVNHGIPSHVLDKMLDGLRMFHELDGEIKKQFYTRELITTGKTFVYNSNYDLYTSRAANWRDSLSINAFYSSGHIDPQEIPEIFRDVCWEYINQVRKLGDILLELISVALGLEPDYLNEKLECSNGWSLVNHYYPACPAPELTIGTSKHTDPSFITILLQDQIGGLQVFNDNQWVDVQPIPGAFVVNIGDNLQILSNDKLKSVYHRVKSNLVGPRVSVAFFLKGLLSSPKLYGPIQELLSEENPSVYREFSLREFQTKFFTSPLGERILESFKIQQYRDESNKS
ncbi:1-aminocyclopropane-1-carboxylate oxidase homolog 1-like isoform X1 [Amaranthus tricolor]|uniref:1-aminocyclopropane-1-carboxylate oxidase homolog 1-like isoform X1 n=1 Tax=Amaranthus tricolor TaxID=29722 RepID=UPI002585652C|nr:1-aminocyclopropane-1-carboxylate oxidase homolog 1-like isoform X1 [Amaranthus tricolor]